MVRRSCICLPILLVASSLAAQAPLPRRGALGATLGPLTDSIRTAHRLEMPEGGVVVRAVAPGSTAETLGVRVGDVVLAVGERPATAPAEVVRALAPLTAGAPIDLRTSRDGVRVPRRGLLGARPLERGAGWETVTAEIGAPGTRQRVLLTVPAAPGLRPVLFLIGGIGGYSLDGPLETIAYGRVLRAFTEAGWITVRVDKPGQGDSEGNPAITTLRFEQELAGYRAALDLVMRDPRVDSNRVVIFGHSMGGSHGPILAGERPSVRGLAVYGTIGVPFLSYWATTLRRQYGLGGLDGAELERRMANATATMRHVFDEGMAPVDVARRYPELAGEVSAAYGDGATLSGMGLGYFRELHARDISAIWRRVHTRTLVMAGEADFVATREDHPIIAALVNEAHPGRAEYRLLPGIDHFLNRRASYAESFGAMGQPGEWNPIMLDTLFRWAGEVVR